MKKKTKKNYSEQSYRILNSVSQPSHPVCGYFVTGVIAVVLHKPMCKQSPVICL
jgi:hypothetical protein